METSIIPEVARDLTVSRDPVEVLTEAKRAAQALTDVLKGKKNPVMINGKQYLEFEDWSLVARFYGCTAKVVETNVIHFGDVVGFEARAVTFHLPTGQEISSASAMCLNDEEEWSLRTRYEWQGPPNDRKKVKIGEAKVPLFQLRSMAQTRACAKALRNVFSWVVVLAGYRPSVAEEEAPRSVKQPGRKSQQPAQQPANGKTYPLTETHEKLKKEILDFCNGDERGAKEMLLSLTAWRDMDGKEHPGTATIAGCSEKMAAVALQKFNENFIEREPGAEG